jgi:hypothetical protein
LFRIALFALLATAAASAASVVAVYDFNNTLNPVSGVGSASASALTVVDPLSVSSFITDTVNGQSRSVYRFDGNSSPATNQGGLQFTNASLMTSNSYSVELYFSFDAVTGWRRIIDTLDRTSDLGFYVLNGGLQLYPSNIGVGTFSPNTYYHVILTYSGTQAIAYLNGVAQSTQTTDYYDLPLSGIISLFLDNTSGPAQTEYSGGKIAWARFYDGVVDASAASAAFTTAQNFDSGAGGGTGGGGNVPEPSTFALAAAGALLALARRRR